MPRFSGKVGYSTVTETAPGVHEDVITERSYFGDVEQNIMRSTPSDKVQTDLALSHTIRIVADDFAMNRISAIRYVEWAGERWTITNVEVHRPRLLLRLGEVYNGPTP